MTPPFAFSSYAIRWKSIACLSWRGIILHAWLKNSCGDVIGLEATYLVNIIVTTGAISFLLLVSLRFGRIPFIPLSDFVASLDIMWKSKIANDQLHLSIASSMSTNWFASRRAEPVEPRWSYQCPARRKKRRFSFCLLSPKGTSNNTKCSEESANLQRNSRSACSAAKLFKNRLLHVTVVLLLSLAMHFGRIPFPSLHSVILLPISIECENQKACKAISCIFRSLIRQSLDRTCGILDAGEEGADFRSNLTYRWNQWRRERRAQQQQ